MIEVFKLLESMQNVDYNQFFTLATTCYALRRHDRKLIKMRSRVDARKFFFSQRVANSWNRLPASIVQATSVNMFKKNACDKHLAGGMDAKTCSLLYFSDVPADIQRMTVAPRGMSLIVVCV